MADGVDTSSYPRAVAQPTALDIAGKLGGLKQQQQQIESGGLTIDKQKLDLVNQRFGEMSKGFSALIGDPNVNLDKVKKYVTDQVKLGYIPPEMAATTLSNIPPTDKMPPQQAAATIREHLKQQLQHAQTVVDTLNDHVGSPGTLDIGNGQVPTNTSRYGGIRSTGPVIAAQPSPNRQEYGDDGRPVFRDDKPPIQPPGSVIAPPPVNPAGPIASQPQGLPAGSVPASAIPHGMVRKGETPISAVVEQPTFTDRFNASKPSFAGPAPMFEEGKKLYASAQEKASSLMTANKPAEQALKLMPGLATGPGTGQFNDLVAAAKAWGIADTKAENDPTVLRQELEKKLAQFVGSSAIAQRSDAAQALAEMSNPNPKKQILPALINLTRDAIALNRVQAALPNAFKGSDFQNFHKHAGTFPQSIDEKAFGLDLMPKEESQKIVKNMANKLQSDDSSEKSKADKFFKSLRIAKEQGFYN